MAKRITVLAGHYGSGKTNLAVNLAFALKKEERAVKVADLDVVNPYFRTKDSAEDLKEAGIGLISSEYANSNVDIPALPPEMYSIVDDRSTSFLVDVGGDDRGALALGRLTPAILEEENYEMLLVANFYRPLTRDANALLEVVREIEAAAGMRFTRVVNNSNLGEETTPKDILDSIPIAEAFSALVGLPLIMTSVRFELYEALNGKIENLFPMQLQKKYY